jgi:hypothetical protein
MGSFKDFYHTNSKHFYLSEQEKVNIQSLANMSEGSDRIIAILTRPDGRKGLAVVKKSALVDGKLGEGDILSGIMDGNSKRIKEIFKWLETIDIKARFPFVELAKKETVKREKPKKSILRAIKETIIGSES